MPVLNLKPSHKPVKVYYETLQQYERIGVSHEGAVRQAFSDLLKSCCSQFDWTLVTEWQIKRSKQKPLQVDGALIGTDTLPRGYWEAKDIKDNLDKEIKKKFQVLQKEFGKSLSDKGVHILDPFVGTGNFIMRVMREIRKTALPYKFEHELHCNEVMLLPYYIASMNIEHEYLEQTGNYQPFEGICLVDTFSDEKVQQLSLFAPENTERVNKQRQSPIFVVIGNPPYNANQVNENDNNKNRKYGEIDRRVKETYAKDSKATNKNALSDPYVKAIRWASDRLGEDGIVAFVSNNSFINDISFDGMRKNLQRDFDAVYILDLGG
jgi:predicted helicase